MTRFILLAGAAALAFGSAATAAPQGKSKDKGSAKVERSQKQAKAKGNSKRAEARFVRASNDRRANVRVKQKDRAKVKVADRGDRREFVRIDRDRDDRRDRIEARRDNRDRLVRLDRDWEDNAKRRGVWSDNGCPPGLDKRAGPCVPPGQMKNLVGRSVRVAGDRVMFRELPSRLRTLYRDNDDYYYRYGNGYAYRINRDNDVISSLLPLFGLGTTIGQRFPAAYSNSYLPTGLRSFYPDSRNTSYRYANGYVYEVNPITGLVEDVNPTLGYGYGYGQMMPANYSAYNVPSQYRSLYQDNNDHYYRYAPGSIYRVDAGSGLIDSVAALLMPGGLAVGQQLPMGYDAYNVPMAYRSQYYDSPQNMYRYANGSIYQVDPTTRLVTAIISALT